MARRRTRRKKSANLRGRAKTPQQRKFKTAARGAMATCIKEAGGKGGAQTTVMNNYKKCMRREMRRRL